MNKLPIILKDRYTLALFLLAALILFFGFSKFYVNLWDSKNLLVIHFDAYRGADFFGTASDVLDILISAVIVLLVNLVLANELYLRERFLSYAIATSTPVFMLLILIAVRVIISIN